VNDDISLRVRFLGGAETVTGSKYLLTFGEKKILVDCGLFQGLKELRLKNWDRFPVDPQSIDAIILTHAHIDHSGYIPRLIKEGFKGKIYCTQATKALCRILLLDTGFLQEEEAKFLNKRKMSKHHPALPLFSKKEAESSLEQFVARDFEKPFEVIPGLKAEFLYAGHILGASMVVVEAAKRKIGFSGDLGRPNNPVFFPPVPMPQVDYLIVESTYGDRRHPSSDPMVELESIIQEAVQKKSVIVIPAFAVGRAQELMFLISELRKARRIPKIPVYLNSPMATNVTALLSEFKSLHKLSQSQIHEMSEVIQYVKTVEDSKALNEKQGPMLIISASGMATGGRVLHHLKAFAPDPHNLIVISGYQALGTRGRAIQDGAREIKFHHEMIPIRASVRILENTSAHADYSEVLQWLSKSHLSPKQVFITHGEKDAAQEMMKHISDRFGWNCRVPRLDQEFTL